MPLPRPRGHNSSLPFCFFLHLPSCTGHPLSTTKDRTDTVWSGVGRQDESEEGWKVVAGVKCDLSGLVTDGGAEGVMGSGQGKK